MATKTEKILIIFLIATFFIAFLTGYILGTLISQIKISNVATIKTIGLEVFWNQNLTNPVTHIDWGTLTPDSSKTTTIYIKSLSTIPTTLIIYTENWNPSNASDFITLTANPNNITIDPHMVVVANLTLSVAPNIQGITTFTFDIWITAQEN